jgi:glycosyltransferase involved in cell wall biosynthesis
MENPSVRPLRVAFVGTYPPRQCGIATFTHDLAAAVSEPWTAPARGATWTKPARQVRDRSSVTDIVAVDSEVRDFPQEVRLRLDPERPADYLGVADRLNRAGHDVVSVQHEFGIYGGVDGERIVDLLEELDVAAVTTLHTVLSHPSDHQRRLLRLIARASCRVVVLSHGAAHTLADVYDIDRSRIRVIPHGVPDLPFIDPDTVKPSLGLAGRPTVLSFGLLGPGKGYELAIRAMSDVVRQAPEACYVILGATHPELRRRDGEAYRHALQSLVAELGLGQHVRFVDEYVSLPALGRWLQAADVFVTPYPGAEQAVSGTLAYALGTGKALVSTPYAYALELLAEGRGRLAQFGDSAALGREIGRFLTDRVARDEARRRAYAYGRRMTWERVGAAYRELFAEVAAERASERAGSEAIARLVRQPVGPGERGPVPVDREATSR